MGDHPDPIIDELRSTLAREPGLTERLEGSLRRAREAARAELREELFDALDWPETVSEYEDYLIDFNRWVPRQTDSKAWQSQQPGERNATEVSDRMAHFYFLVDQEVDGEAPQTCSAFREWMTEFARQWGDFLDTTDSFSAKMLQEFMEQAPEYRIGESLIDGVPNMPSGWLTFNQFMARELNDGLRPITEPGDNLVVTSPADCIFMHHYDIDADSKIPAITVKNTHKYGDIKRLLEGSEYAESFAGGTFVHYELPPWAYHRYHLPVAGQVRESFKVSGKAFMEVRLEDHGFQPSDSATSGFEFTQNRGVVTVDTAESGCGDVGIVAVVPVGMAHVSSVTLTAVQGSHCPKGDRFG